MIEEHENAMNKQGVVFGECIGIYDRRRRFRGDAWLTVENPIRDLEHHIEDCFTRVKAICELLPSLVDDEYAEALDEALDDLRDLINYAAFLDRYLRGERRR